MSKLLEWIESNIKDGVDIAEVKPLVQEITVNIENREDAAAFIEKNTFVKAELDSKISKSVDNALERFKESKLPGLLDDEREKIRKELDPDETPEQKEIRELREQLQKNESERAIDKRKADLRKKANELKYDPDRAEGLFIYGEDAEKVLEKEVEYFQSQLKSGIEQVIKEKYGDTPPPTKGQKTDGKFMKRPDFERLSPTERAEFAKAGGKLED